jgi:hypothetical protein
MSRSGGCCPDCAAGVGEYHVLGCDVEQCPYCGGQLIFCDCRRKPPLDDRLLWSGHWPGVMECREFGWYARMVPGRGWVSCAPNEPGASEDLNRLHVEGGWSRKRNRFVLPKQPKSPPS